MGQILKQFPDPPTNIEMVQHLATIGLLPMCHPSSSIHHMHGKQLLFFPNGPGFFCQVTSYENEVGEKSSMRTKISFETSPARLIQLSLTSGQIVW